MRAAPLLSVIPLLAAASCGPGELDLSGPAVEVRGAPLVSLGGSSPSGSSPSGDSPTHEPPLPVAESTGADATQGEVLAATLGPDPEATPPPADTGEPAWVSWDLLSGFDYFMLDLNEVLAIQEGGQAPDLEERFPTEVVDLAGRRIELEGFMIPFEYDDRGIVSFTLVRDQAQCCFGASPQMNHWVDVVMSEGQRSGSFGMDPIFVRGTFSVGEAVEDGFVTSIYRLVADEVEGAY